MEAPNENDSFIAEFKEEHEVIECEQSNKPLLVRNMERIIRNISVEPLVILLIAPRWICSLTLENLFLEKACWVNLSLNETICQALALRDRSGYAPQDEIAVHRVVSEMLPYKAACHMIQLFFIFMIGSWTDRTGRRKTLFIFPYLGDIAAALGHILCVYFFMELSVEYLVLIDALFSISLGGIPMLMTGVYSYIAVTTDCKSRTFRIGIVFIVLRTSLTLGIASSGFMYRYFGFYCVFLIALSMNLIGLVYLFAAIKSVKPIKKAVERGKELLCFRLVWNGMRESVVASLQICFKSGPNRRRTRMILLQLINILSMGVLSAEASVLYLFSRKQFGWDEVDFSFFKCYKTIVEIIGYIVVVIFLSKFRKWTDVQIGLLACLSRFIATTVMVCAKSGQLLYIGTFTDVFNGAVVIATRSMITKCVDQNEQALANSLTGIFDSFGVSVMGFLYAFVYYQTIAIFPGAFFLVSLLSSILIFVMLLIIRNVVLGTENVLMDHH